MTPASVQRALLAIALLPLACGARPEPAPQPVAAKQEPAPVAPAPEPVAAKPETTVAAAPAQAPIVFDGDNDLPPRFVAPFVAWLQRAQTAWARFKLVAASAVSNSGRALLEEQSGGAECRLRWLWIEAMDREDGGGVGEVEVSRFGGDCCDGGACARDLAGHHLHLLRAVAAKDWRAVLSHVPAATTVAYALTSPAGKEEQRWKPATIEAGEAAVPGCGPLDTLPSCDEAANAEGVFDCRCDGGGYHITYTYRLPAEPVGLATLVAVDVQED